MIKKFGGGEKGCSEDSVDMMTNNGVKAVLIGPTDCKCYIAIVI